RRRRGRTTSRTTPRASGRRRPRKSWLRRKRGTLSLTLSQGEREPNPWSSLRSDGTESLLLSQERGNRIPQSRAVSFPGTSLLGGLVVPPAGLLSVNHGRACRSPGITAGGKGRLAMKSRTSPLSVVLAVLLAACTGQVNQGPIGEAQQALGNGGAAAG